MFYENDSCAMITDLNEKIDACKQDLLELLDMWHFYNDEVYRRIMFVYDSIFGDLEEELDSKTQEASELERRIELIRLKMRKGEKLTEKSLKFVNLIVEREKQRGIVQRSVAQTTQAQPARPAAQPKPYEPTNNLGLDLRCQVNDQYEIPQLYRQLVKKLHPDVTGDTDAFNKYWESIQLAYKSQDADRLRLYCETLCDDEPNTLPDKNSTIIMLKTKVRELETNIKKQKRKIEELKTQEPFSFEKKLNDKFWISRRKNMLRERLIQVDKRLQHNNRMLKFLTSRVEDGATA